MSGLQVSELICEHSEQELRAIIGGNLEKALLIPGFIHLTFICLQVKELSKKHTQNV